MGDSISDLIHPSVNLDNGGEVIILNTGAVIDAESVAMLEALHSRSTGGLRAHLKKVAEKGSGNFIKSTYVGYGHKSIGDCAPTSIFVEGVSMLVAKAVQDHALYSGQEASTRYIDFSKQPFIDPTRSDAGKALLEMQRTLYLEAEQPTRDALKKLHPIGGGEDLKIYEKAIAARAFDITRSLLPAGASTNFAWQTNLRQAADKMLFLRHHPLPEVREVCGGLEQALNQHHPNSFGQKKYEATEQYQEVIAANYLFHDLNSPLEPVVDFTKIDRVKLDGFRELLDSRPPKTELPKFVGHAGNVTAVYQLDFGSFRDIQRHRAINQRMPLLTTELGFNQWYLENLPSLVVERLPRHLELINEGIRKLRVSKEEAQYFIPMGYNTANIFTGDLPATIYMVELRDTRFVHPTLQKVAHSIGTQISDNLGIPLHLDAEPGRFDVRRGGHDITIK